MKNPKNYSRRQFLRGIGGFTLALPFLPSLLPKSAKAQQSTAPYLVQMATSHGGVWPEFMYPAENSLSQSFDYAGRACRWGSLQGSVSDGRTHLSSVLSGPSDKLSNDVIARLNVVRGIDIPYYIAHHTGGHLGNFARNDGNGPDGRYMQGFPVPTIDQFLAYSDYFYPDLTMVTERALAVGAGRMSYNYSSPSTQSGPIQEIHAHTDNLHLYQRLFTPGEVSYTPGPLVVDRILENYRSVRGGNTRLSGDDKRRLDEHMERLYELERRVSIVPDCEGMAYPATSASSVKGTSGYSYSPDLMVQYWQLFNDLVSVAVSCGVCRSFSMHTAGDTFSTYSGDWHVDVAHQAHSPEGGKQQIMMDAHQVFFEGVFLDLVCKLQAIDNGLGGTALDDGLAVWTQESGMMTHEAYGLPIITAGSAGGFFNTGRMVDYRNLDIEYKYLRDGEYSHLINNPGLIYNQWLGNVLQAMGVPASAYESGNYGGYGPYHVSDSRADDYVEATSALSELLPMLVS